MYYILTIFHTIDIDNLELCDSGKQYQLAFGKLEYIDLFPYTLFKQSLKSIKTFSVHFL